MVKIIKRKMVKWSSSWLEKIDSNGVKLKLWVTKKDEKHAHCKLCSADLKYVTQGFQAMIQHSKKPKHKTVSDLRFGNDVRRFSKSSESHSSSKKEVVTLDPTFSEKVSAAEAKWLFKMAERDMTLRDCDFTPELFRQMFPDSQVAKQFSMSRQKASYVLQDGLGPLLSKWLVTSINTSEGTFTLMFDETTTLQNRKQMDLLVRFWDEEQNLVTTRYLTSLFFGRATALDITGMLMSLQEEGKFNLTWSKMFNISSDGPNINKAIWRELNDSLIDKGYKGLLEFLKCPLHTVHNSFHQGIKVGSGQSAEQLAFDFHAWFKVNYFQKSFNSL